MAVLTMQARTLTCPLCDLGFRHHSPRAVEAALIKEDADFCPYHEGPNPVFYEVVVCPGCGFSALEADFSRCTIREAQALRDFLVGRSDHMRFDFTLPERSLFMVIASYQMAQRCYEARGASPAARAVVKQRLGWICRYGNDRKRELPYLEQARDLYTEAFEQANAREEATASRYAYLVGELHRRTGDGSMAVDWFMKAIYGRQRNVDEDIYQRARSQIAEARDSIRFFNYIKDIEILKPLQIEEMAALAPQLRNHQFAEGRILFRQGEAGESMFIVMKGMLRVQINGNDVATVEPGQVAGEMSLLTGLPRSATLCVAQNTEVLEMDRVAFRTILKNNPTIAGDIARIVSARQKMNARGTSPLVDPDPGAAEANLLCQVKEHFDLD